VVHDNQCLGTGVAKLVDEGWPMLATLHHPITVDRDLELLHATRHWKRFTLRRWYGFLDMQMRVTLRLPRLITVSESSRRDIVAAMNIEADRLHVVPVGANPDVFRPLPDVRRVPGRIMTTASADVPMKGLAPLLEALAKVRTERDDAHLVVIGKPKGRSNIPALIDRLGLGGAVTFENGVTTERIVELYAEAELAAVPSLYEGFSLPAVEAMACGVPIVATTGGALPEVIGRDGETGLLVPPGDASALATAILRALDDTDLRARLGAAGRARVLERFTWRITALGTVEHYRAVLAEQAETRAC
jgi:glycosyltransferase involved in cell wall biosynthesis